MPTAPAEGLLSPIEAAAMVDKYFGDRESGLAAEHFERTLATLGELGRQARERMIAAAKSRRDSAS